MAQRPLKMDAHGDGDGDDVSDSLLEVRGSPVSVSQVLAVTPGCI